MQLSSGLRRHAKDLRSRACALFGRSQLLLEYLRFLDCGQPCLGCENRKTMARMLNPFQFLLLAHAGSVARLDSQKKIMVPTAPSSYERCYPGNHHLNQHRYRALVSNRSSFIEFTGYCAGAFRSGKSTMFKFSGNRRSRGDDVCSLPLPHSPSIPGAAANFAGDTCPSKANDSIT